MARIKTNIAQQVLLRPSGSRFSPSPLPPSGGLMAERSWSCAVRSERGASPDFIEEVGTETTSASVAEEESACSPTRSRASRGRYARLCARVRDCNATAGRGRLGVSAYRKN